MKRFLSVKLNVEQMDTVVLRHSFNRDQLLTNSAWPLHLIGERAPPAARDSSEVSRTLKLTLLSIHWKRRVQLVFEQ